LEQIHYRIEYSIVSPSMTTQRSRRRPREETRHQLLDAAARVFARRGLHGTSVEEVSEEAGFSRGALYSNFKSKEDLFLALWEERIERRRRELRDVVENSDDAGASVEAAAANVVEVLGREREWLLLYFEFSLYAARDASFLPRYQNVREQGLAELGEGIARGLKRAGIESSLSSDDLALAIKALSYGIALERLVGEDDLPDALFGRVLQVLFRGLRAEADAAAKPPGPNP
jgi:AcrR family transcriptional regulator